MTVIADKPSTRSESAQQWNRGNSPKLTHGAENGNSPQADAWGWNKNMAERGGFEPPVDFKGLRRFSKPLLSTTQPPLREALVRLQSG
jgi:hypothetical protein